MKPHDLSHRTKLDRLQSRIELERRQENARQNRERELSDRISDDPDKGRYHDLYSVHPYDAWTQDRSFP